MRAAMTGGRLRSRVVNSLRVLCCLLTSARQIPEKFEPCSVFTQDALNVER